MSGPFGPFTEAHSNRTDHKSRTCMVQFYRLRLPATTSRLNYVENLKKHGRLTIEFLRFELELSVHIDSLLY
jgi:hypothetical protein